MTPFLLLDDCNAEQGVAFVHDDGRLAGLKHDLFDNLEQAQSFIDGLEGIDSMADDEIERAARQWLRGFEEAV